MYFVRYAELRCLAGQPVVDELPPGLRNSDRYAGECVNALGPSRWPDESEA